MSSRKTKKRILRRRRRGSKRGRMTWWRVGT
jgi:hypothetical protein